MVRDWDRILYTVRSMPFAARLGESAPPEKGGSRQVPVQRVTRRLNAGHGVVEERGVVPADLCFAETSGELAEKAIGLGRHGKTLTVVLPGGGI